MQMTPISTAVQVSDITRSCPVVSSKLCVFKLRKILVTINNNCSASTVLRINTAGIESVYNHNKSRELSLSLLELTKIVQGCSQRLTHQSSIHYKLIYDFVMVVNGHFSGSVTSLFFSPLIGRLVRVILLISR